MKNVITKTLVASAISTAMLAGAVQAEVTMVSWGGGYAASQQKAYIDTYNTGDVNLISYNGGLGEIRAQVESGNVQWDIADVFPHEARVGCDEGLFEELPRNVFMPAPDGTAMDDDLLVERPNDCVAPQIWWSYVPFHKGDTFSGEQPSTIQDFFDVEKFPGKRGIHTWPNALIEMALYADGVAIADVYDVMSTDEGIDRAFAKLDTIKDHAVFWSAGAKPLDLVGSGEVSMSLAYNGRIGGAILSEGADFHVVWDGQVLEEEWIVMLKGTPNYAEALHFMVHATTTEQQAGQAKWINYGPMRKSAIPLLEANEPFFHTGVDIMPHMPNTPALMENTIVADPVWWADNGEAVADRYSAWMAN